MKSKSGICPPLSDKALRSFAAVVTAYLAHDQERGDADLAWYSDQPDFSALLEQAVMCRTRRRQRHPHQRRIPESVLRAAHKALSKCDLQSCTSFDDLHDRIEFATSGISGIGDLTVFDFACRIGEWLKKRPTKVYLHAGARAGARALGLGAGRKTIEVQELPKEFHLLSGRHAEDCLCCHKDALKAIAARR